MRHAYSTFNEVEFRSKVDASLETIKSILDGHRNPRYAEEHEHHTYDDKYALAETMVNMAISAQINILERMGLSVEVFMKMQEIVVEQKRPVGLCFEAADTCSFVKEQNVEVVKHDGDVSSSVTTETQSGILGGSSTTTIEQEHKHKVTAMVKEQHWNIGVEYRICAFSGSEQNLIELRRRASSTTIYTTESKEAPFPAQTSHSPVTCSLNWLLQNVETEQNGFRTIFKIDRNNETCRTPSRNDDIKKAIEFFQSLNEWGQKCGRYFVNRLEGQLLRTHAPAVPEPTTENHQLSDVAGIGVFLPVLPLFDTDRSTPMLSSDDLAKLLKQHCQSIDEGCSTLAKHYAPNDTKNVISVEEAKLVLLLLATKSAISGLSRGVGYIESMLHKQLVGAIGKEVKSKDFDEFMSFHSKKLFASQYAPKPFCFAIRRPEQFPDGMLTIEHNRGFGHELQPVETFVRMFSDAPHVSVPLSASTTLEVGGSRYCHGLMLNRFENEGLPMCNLAARARQFSSFVLMVGVMSGPNSFTPKDAIILQNKDELLIPLLLQEIPSAQEFKDAISSLSPEQQRFAKAFRSMQLESSVFGVCTIQLKPQLELLLGLPSGGLTKEIRLTQDLLSLFAEYQIPSDLLSFDGPKDAEKHQKLDEVKKHVAAVLQVIEESKIDQLDEAEMKAEMRVATDSFCSRPASPSAASQQYQLSSPSVFHFGGGNMPCPSGFGGPPMPPSSSALGFAFGGPPLPSKNQLGSPPPASSKSIFANTSSTANSFGAPAPAPSGLFGARTLASSRSPFEKTTLPNPANEAMNNEDTRPMHPVAPEESETGETEGLRVFDVTRIPKQLDTRFEKDSDSSSVRATTIELSQSWNLMRKASFLSKPVSSTMRVEDVRSEKNKAFDLLDALSRSGSLTIDYAEFHMVVAVTHCFENDVVKTVVQDNINPIEKVEKSALMVASTIHGFNACQLIGKIEDLQRITIQFPELVGTEEHMLDL